mgnify:CR=1 FL=1
MNENWYKKKCLGKADFQVSPRQSACLIGNAKGMGDAFSALEKKYTKMICSEQGNAMHSKCSCLTPFQKEHSTFGMLVKVWKKDVSLNLTKCSVILFQSITSSLFIISNEITTFLRKQKTEKQSKHER